MRIVPLLLVYPFIANAISAGESGPKETARSPLKLPGMVIDFGKRCVDLEATVCLDEGFLELIACTKGSKEHESIVAVSARPMHIHTALLLIGADNGNPAMRKQVGKKEKRWVNLPPRGDLIEAFLVFKHSDGKLIERPVSEFVMRSKAEKEKRLPHTFLFAGSHLRANGKGRPRQYLADLSGHVISIATFGDELLCLPGVHSHADDGLMWQVNPRHLPKVGTKVTLRLRPRTKPNSGNGAASGSAITRKRNTQ